MAADSRLRSLCRSLRQLLLEGEPSITGFHKETTQRSSKGSGVTRHYTDRSAAEHDAYFQLHQLLRSWHLLKYTHLFKGKSTPNKGVSRWSQWKGAATKASSNKKLAFSQLAYQFLSRRPETWLGICQLSSSFHLLTHWYALGNAIPLHFEAHPSPKVSILVHAELITRMVEVEEVYCQLCRPWKPSTPSQVHLHLCNQFTTLLKYDSIPEWELTPLFLWKRRHRFQMGYSGIRVMFVPKKWGETQMPGIKTPNSKNRIRPNNASRVCPLPNVKQLNISICCCSVFTLLQTVNSIKEKKLPTNYYMY